MQVIEVEQGSYEWHCYRQGCVTGTALKSALGTPKVQDTLLAKLVSERMTEPQISDLNSPAVARGNEMEPIARSVAEEVLGLTFHETGMLQDVEFERFRISPDGICLADGKVVGGIEIKCPDSKKHVEYMIKDEVPTEYLPQVKAPFIMSPEVKFWHFVSYDDRNYERPLFVKTVLREDLDTLEADREKLKAFLDRVEQTHIDLTF